MLIHSFECILLVINNKAREYFSRAIQTIILTGYQSSQLVGLEKIIKNWKPFTCILIFSFPFFSSLGSVSLLLMASYFKAKEYVSVPFNYCIASHAVIFQSNCFHTPQHNGLAKQKRSDFVDQSSNTLKFRSGLNLIACHLINCMSSFCIGNWDSSLTLVS